MAYVRSIFAVYEVACVTQPRLFLRCYEPSIWPECSSPRLVSGQHHAAGNVRVSTRFRFTQLSSAVKNGVPPPTRTG